MSSDEGVCVNDYCAGISVEAVVGRLGCVQGTGSCGTVDGRVLTCADVGYRRREVDARKRVDVSVDETLFWCQPRIIYRMFTSDACLKLYEYTHYFDYLIICTIYNKSVIDKIGRAHV